ncbi:MAG: prenyltransferase/squalene oxidase repeat-containing protein [Acidobacteriota bacterium]
MSLRLEMLQVARLAPQLLGDSADLVAEFLRSRLSDGGGFLDRDDRPDLYYTVFGLDGLAALGAEMPVATVEPYLRSFGAGDDLDTVHLGCLARCWGALPGVEPDAAHRARMLERFEALRRPDGGFALEPPKGDGGDSVEPEGAVYASFVAFGAYEDLGAEPPGRLALGDFLTLRALPNGAFANDPDLAVGTTPVSAAAITLLRSLSRPVPEMAASWVADRLHRQGGFLAAPQAPMPDLLSTAVALHALAGLQYPLDTVVEPCLDFVDSLWTRRGGFHGHWADDELDVEYTFYGLLALGHLSVWTR